MECSFFMNTPKIKVESGVLENLKRVLSKKGRVGGLRVSGE